jgi:hypothetical protein
MLCQRMPLQSQGHSGVESVVGGLKGSGIRRTHVLNTSTTKLQHYKKRGSRVARRFYRWGCSMGRGSPKRAVRRSIGLRTINLWPSMRFARSQ